jgi:hypothetical protein
LTLLVTLLVLTICPSHDFHICQLLSYYVLAYNFWTDPGWEEYDGANNWVDEKVHYRSPEAFHEAILSGNQLLATDLWRELRQISVETLRKVQALVGKDNLVVLKNEDLKPNRIHESGLLQRIIQATGLDPEGFDESVLRSRSNCNANKGYGALCSDNEREHNIDKKNTPPSSTSTTKAAADDKTKTAKKKHHTTTTRTGRQIKEEDTTDTTIISATTDAVPLAVTSTKEEQQLSHSRTVGYPVTHFRPMLESTRKFIYLQWHKECKIWFEDFGVEYPECLAAIPMTEGSTTHHKPGESL